MSNKKLPTQVLRFTLHSYILCVENLLAELNDTIEILKEYSNLEVLPSERKREFERLISRLEKYTQAVMNFHEGN